MNPIGFCKITISQGNGFGLVFIHFLQPFSRFQIHLEGIIFGCGSLVNLASLEAICLLSSVRLRLRPQCAQKGNAFLCKRGWPIVAHCAWCCICNSLACSSLDKFQRDFALWKSKRISKFWGVQNIAKMTDTVDFGGKKYCLEHAFLDFAKYQKETGIGTKSKFRRISNRWRSDRPPLCKPSSEQNLYVQ